MLCNEKQFHVQWRDFQMNVLVCDDERQIVNSVIETLKRKPKEHRYHQDSMEFRSQVK